MGRRHRIAVAAALAAYVVLEVGLLEEPVTMAGQQLAASYAAVLSDESDVPGLVITAFDNPWRLAIELLEGLTVPDGAVLRIWAVERDTGTATPLARVGDRAPVQVAMSEAIWSMVQNATTLIVSLDGAESDGPGPALCAGPCIRLEGPPGMRSGAAPKWPDD